MEKYKDEGIDRKFVEKSDFCRVLALEREYFRKNNFNKNSKILNKTQYPQELQGQF